MAREVGSSRTKSVMTMLGAAAVFWSQASTAALALALHTARRPARGWRSTVRGEGVSTPWDTNSRSPLLSCSPLARALPSTPVSVVSGQGLGQPALGHTRGQAAAIAGYTRIARQFVACRVEEEEVKMEVKVTWRVDRGVEAASGVQWSKRPWKVARRKEVRVWWSEGRKE